MHLPKADALTIAVNFLVFVHIHASKKEYILYNILPI
jgi:hypothetical protein